MNRLLKVVHVPDCLQGPWLHIVEELFGRVAEWEMGWLWRFGCKLGRFCEVTRSGWGRVYVASLSSFAREVMRLEVIMGGDKWRLSLACLATRSDDSCVGLPRLYETVVQEGQGGDWEEDMVGVWTGKLPAGGWEKGSRMGFFVSQASQTRKITHCCKSTQSLKKHCLGIFVLRFWSLHYKTLLLTQK
jgi:hypothetical protein